MFILASLFGTKGSTDLIINACWYIEITGENINTFYFNNVNVDGKNFRTLSDPLASVFCLGDTNYLDVKITKIDKTVFYYTIKLAWEDVDNSAAPDGNYTLDRETRLIFLKF